MIEVTVIPGQVLDKFWPQVRDFVSDALDHSMEEITLDQLKDRLDKFQAQLWAVLAEKTFVGAAVTEVLVYPNMKALRIITLGGVRMGSWARELSAVLESYADKVEASRIEAVGRRGFVKRLAPLGYRPAYTVLVKDLEDVENRRNGNSEN